MPWRLVQILAAEVHFQRPTMLPGFRTLVLALAFAAAMSCAAVAQSPMLTVDYSFCEQASCGQNPDTGPVQATDGNLYGTTEYGGTNGSGTVYQITAQGGATLYSFCSQTSCADGEYPSSGLLEVSGVLYGVTEVGGAGHAGTIFSITPSGTFTSLYSFCSQANCPDGQNPLGTLVLGPDNYLYGVTNAGGTHVAGSVFRISTSGTNFATVYSFCSLSCDDGSGPSGGLVLGSDGNLYGTTARGGTNGFGTVFQLSTSGVLKTLYSFCSQANCTDGQEPETSLVESAGAFYGTTSAGGANPSKSVGTLFKVTPAGAFTSLYSFCSKASCSDGSLPDSGLLLASDGNFYGSTENGGSPTACSGAGCGTLFQLTPAGALTSFYAFCEVSCETDGAHAEGNLIQASNHQLYGATDYGGAYSNGEIFTIPLPASPGAATTTALTASPNPVTQGQEVTLSASVSKTGTGAAPTGAVAFQFAGSTLATASLSSASASVKFPTQGLPAGGYTLTAVYSGDANYSGSTSAAYTVTIAPDKASVTTLKASPTSVSIGSNLVFTATVAGEGVPPTGSVTLSVNGATLASASLNSGAASVTFNTSGVPVGTFPILATYSGDANYNPSSSSASVSVTAAATSTTVVASPASVTPPASSTFTATVKRSAAGAQGVPAGTVAFYYSTLLLETVTLNSKGTATYTVPTSGFPAGTYTLTAKYSGDAGDNPSTGNASLTVQ